MKKSELWAIYTKKNPSFAGDGNVTLSARGLRKLFNQTWDTAYHDGEAEEKIPYFQQKGSALEELERIFGFK